MTSEPILETTRLRLRPYCPADVLDLVSLIGAREVAATTLRIPHPYTEEDARQFLNSIGNESGVRLAVTLRREERLIGGIGLHRNDSHQHAELGYWLGVPYWGQGYATEAARELLRYGFEDLQLHRIFASHFSNNPASGGVLKKLGMRYEGFHRQHVRKFGEFLNLELYGILRDEWQVHRREVRE